LWACCDVRGSILFDQSPPNDNATDFVNSRLADDFTLSSATLVDGVNFWYSAQFQTDLSSVTYAIYSNNAGALGALQYTGTVTPATSYDSTDNTFFAQIALPDLSLSAGTYWLELHGGVSLTDDNGTITVWWDNAADNGTYMALQSPSSNPLAAPSVPITVSGSEQQAFQIDGIAVPEPWSVLMGGCGLSLVVLKRRRLRSRGCSCRITTNHVASPSCPFTHRGDDSCRGPEL